MGSGKTMLVSEMAQAVLKEDAPVCIEAFDGSTFGPEDADLQVRVTSPKAIYQLASNLNEIGLARAYILGYFDIEGLDVADPYPQLRKLVELASYIRKPSPLELARMGAAVLSHGYHKVEVPQSEGPSKFERIKSGLFPHTEKADSETVSFHYDLSNEFYADFIGPSMTYTCAVFDTPDMSLDDAQRNKIDLVLDKLDLKPGDRMLDIGCGWGALVIAAAKRGIKALGVSLSHEQIEYGQEWIRREGLENLAELRVMDYREVPERDFDGITSVGMMEHVGAKNYRHYFDEMFKLLKPAGHLRQHYALTLHHWNANLKANWADAVKQVGYERAKVYGLYLAACELNFELNGIQVHQFLAVKPDKEGLPKGNWYPLRPWWAA